MDPRRYALPLVGASAVVLLGLHTYFAFLQPYYSFVDDLTYIAAAFNIINHVQCPLAAGTLCNYEHPPLSKLLMALGFEIFGKFSTVGSAAGTTANQFGGRFFQMLMGSFSAPVLYLIVNRITGSWKTSVIAASLVLVDPLYFTLSNTAILDDAMVFFALLAILPYLYARELGKTRSLLITGSIFGLSLLSKESGAFILLAMLSYVLLTETASLKTRLTSCLWIVVGATAVFCVGLEIYDVIYTPFPSFLSQLALILSFHAGAGPGQITYLTSISDCSNTYVGLCPTNRSLLPHVFYSMLPLMPLTNGQCTACWAATNPLDWLFYMPPVVFPGNLVLAPNYLLVWLAFLWVPFAVWGLRRMRGTPAGNLFTLALLLFGWNVFSNILIFSVLGRGVFLWYFLPAVPALAMGGAALLTRPRVPWWATTAATLAIVGMGIFLSPFVLPNVFSGSVYFCNTC